MVFAPVQTRAQFRDVRSGSAAANQLVGAGGGRGVGRGGGAAVAAVGGERRSPRAGNGDLDDENGGIVFRGGRVAGLFGRHGIVDGADVMWSPRGIMLLIGTSMGTWTLWDISSFGRVVGEVLEWEQNP